MEIDYTQLDNDPALMDPDSPEFAALMNPPDDDPEAKQDELSAPSGAVEGTEETKAPETDPDTPEGVLAADGKHVIPYDVLRASREAEARARESLQQAQAEIEALKRQAEQANQGKAIEVDVEASDAVDDKLAKLVEDFPELGEFAAAMTKQLTDMRGQVTQLVNERDRLMHEDQSQRRLTVREAIDNNPHLSLWEREDAEAWERAKAFDSVLKERPEWQGKPVQDRFERVVKLVQADYETAKSPSITPRADDKSLEQKAREALAQADDPPIESLSHLPGGSSPTDQEAQGLSPTALEAMFESWPQDKIDAFLLKHAV